MNPIFPKVIFVYFYKFNFSFQSKVGYGSLSSNNVDSGVGRTLSSCGRAKFRSRSEERSSSVPIIYNNYGTALSEPLMESSANIHTSNHLNRPEERSLLAGIPPPPKSQIFSQCDGMKIDRHNSGQNHSGSNSHHQNSHHKQRKGQKVEDTLQSYQAKKLQVPPLNSTRLQPTRHRTKTAVLTILSNGEVCIEFIKIKNFSVSKRFVKVKR